MLRRVATFGAEYKNLVGGRQWPWRRRQRRRISILINYTWECVCASLRWVFSPFRFKAYPFQRAAAQPATIKTRNNTTQRLWWRHYKHNRLWISPLRFILYVYFSLSLPRPRSARPRRQDALALTSTAAH